MDASKQSPPTLKTVDAILSHYAKTLKPGESIQIPLIKGKSTTTSVDPIIHSRSKTSTSSAGNTDGSGVPAASRIVQEKFPKIAKFIETVEKPDFQKCFQNGRFYQEDIPKAQADSDDEEDKNKDEVNPRKRKRYRRKRPARQHWVIQTNEEFNEKLKLKRIKMTDPKNYEMFESSIRNKLSNRYEGLPESNNSHYVLFSATEMASSSASKQPAISVMPMHDYISFTQPAKFKRLSMHDAEDAIASQKISRYMMHNNLKHDKDAMNSRNNTMMGNNGSAANNMARSRIFGKLMNDKDDGDVMTDVAFREEKAGVSVQTRLELLSDIGDDIKVDHDGTLGGANDAEFAGKRRFGQMKSGMKKARAEGNSEKQTKSNDGAVDDFYQQDVGAQFDNVDCDLDGLFDNNDQDMGAGDQDDYDLGGFADAEDDESDDEEDDDFDDVGFQSKHGMKAIIAKAKGENPENLPNFHHQEIKSQRGGHALSSGSDRSDDEKEASASKRKSPDPSISANNSKKNEISKENKILQSSRETKIRQVDENGMIIISKEAVRREIWLHNGTIAPKSLFKKFKANGKKYKDRKKVIMDICLELCTMEANQMLVLKQHYAKM